GLSPENYKASDFYGHIFTFQMIEAPKAPTGPEQIIVNSLEQLLSEAAHDVDFSAKAIHDVKLFGCMIDGQFDLLAKTHKKKSKKLMPTEMVRTSFQDI